jgi:hypothetical protein
MMKDDANPGGSQHNGGIDEMLRQSAGMTPENRDTILAEGYSYLLEKIFWVIERFVFPGQATS